MAVVGQRTPFLNADSVYVFILYSVYDSEMRRQRRKRVKVDIRGHDLKVFGVSLGGFSVLFLSGFIYIYLRLTWILPFKKKPKQKTRSLQGIFYTPTLTVMAHLNDEAGRVFSHSWLEFCCEQKTSFLEEGRINLLRRF